MAKTIVPQQPAELTWRIPVTEKRLDVAFHAACRISALASLAMDQLEGADNLAALTLATTILQLANAQISALDDDREDLRRLQRQVFGMAEPELVADPVG